MQEKLSGKRGCKDFEQNLVLRYYAEDTEVDQKRIETHLTNCVSCRSFLEELRKILPLTSKPDEPPQDFWQSYSEEMHRRLAAAEEKTSWRNRLLSFFHPWSIPALAAALAVILVVVLTLSEGIWRSQQVSQRETSVHVQPVADNLEFFKAMDLLDSIDLLESIDAKDASHKGA